MESLLKMSEAAIKANVMYHLAVRDGIMAAHIKAAKEVQRWVEILEHKQELRNQSEQDYGITN